MAGQGVAIMELAEWLRSLGLEQYEATFRENAIDETVLRDLSEDHLRELGFRSVCGSSS